MAKKVLTQTDDSFAWTAAQVLAGRDGDDTITALGGNDRVNAGNGDNTVYGGQGNDTLFASQLPDLTNPGVQRFYGGDGNDWLTGGELGDLLGGDNGRDLLIGNGGDDTIYGGADQDFFRAFAFEYDAPMTGRDVMYGGDGGDVFNLRAGDAGLYAAEIYGGAGNDLITWVGGGSLIFGGDGNDNVQGRIQSEVAAAVTDFNGGQGYDRLDLLIRDEAEVANSWNNQTVMTANGLDLAIAVNGAARATIEGFEKLTMEVTGDSTLLGTFGNDEFLHIGGNLQIDAGRGFDRVDLRLVDDDPAVLEATYDLNGGDGRDRLTLQADFLTLGAVRLDMRGEVGVLQIGDGPEGRVTGFELYTVIGSQLGDTAYLGAENDTFAEGFVSLMSGDDLVHGGAGDDSVTTGAEADSLYGDAGNDMLFAGDGIDLLYGGDGADTLNGGAGADRFYGGLGADVFYYADESESGTVAGRIDNIFGFVTHKANADQADALDLSILGELSFIGTDRFTEAGQVRLYQAEGGTFVAINLVGDSGAEMRIALPNITAADLGIDDFIL